MKQKPIEYITISGITSPTAMTTAEARLLRDSLLAELEAVKTVTSAEQSDATAEIWRRATDLSRYIENAREAAKEKPLQLCRDIDKLGHELNDNLKAGTKRVGQVLAAWQTEQNRIAEQARRDAWEKEQEIDRESARVAKEAADKEAQRVAELERKASVARTPEKAQEYANAAQEVRSDAEQKQADRDDQTRNSIIATRQVAAVLAPRKQTGIATKQVLKFEVTDLTLLYESYPILVKLVANDQAIIAALKGLQAGRHIPGIRHWWVSESVGR